MRLLLVICLVSFDAIGQSKDGLVLVDAPKVKAQSGHEVLIRVFVSVKNGYHIQAHNIEDEQLIPTTLEIAKDKAFSAKRQVFPPAKKFTVSGTNQYLEVYDGNFEIQSYLSMSDPIQKGVCQLKGILKYQACDSLRCFFPRTAEFLVNIEVQ